MPYVWDFAIVLHHGDLLWHGLWATLALTGLTIVIAVPLGVLLAVLLLGARQPFVALARGFVDFFRTSALLVLLMWFYFAFPIIARVRIDAFTAATLALGLQNAAYLAEVFRAGIRSVPRGQWEAGRVLGLRLVPLFFLVIVPQALRTVLPVLVNVLSEIVKGTSLAAAIAYTELSYQASLLASTTYRPLETYTLIAVMYFVVIALLNQLAAFLERRLSLPGERA